MVAWMRRPRAARSDAPWLLRLPAPLGRTLGTGGSCIALRRWFARDEDTANLAALALLLIPMNVWNVLVTTDTPLVLFSVASLLVFALAAEKDSSALFFPSGMLLGLAFLSKYFAFLLSLAYLAWALFSEMP